MDNNREILPVKSDVIFRLFFADERNEDLLVSFLKSILKLSDDDFGEIKILDPHLLREYDKDKLGIIDVKLRTKNKKIIHIEIQLQVTPELKNRIVFYDAKLITEQIGSGEDYNTIKKVISIIITDETLIQNSERYHHSFTLYDHEAGVELTDLIEINTLELCKLPKDTDGTKLYDWSEFISADTKEKLEKVSARNSEVKKAMIKLMELSADEQARDMYFRREMERRDISAQKRWAAKKNSLEIAKKALEMNISIEDILKLTGLTFEELEDLRQGKTMI